MGVTVEAVGLAPGANPAGPAGTPTGTTTSVQGKVTAPIAGQTIAITAALGAGNYDVQVATFTSATDVDNMQLQVNATVIGPVADALQPSGVMRFRVAVPAGGQVSVNAIGAGTAGIVYSATIAVTPVV